MEYLFGIVILLGALIFFHELGHFVVAKFCGVKVEVFSLGFGTKLIKKKIGETQYCLSLIPLGGYVKLYGEDPTEPVKTDAKHSFSKQPVSRRIAIAAAGPIFNLGFAVLIFFVMEVSGIEKVVAPYLAHVTPGSQAWELGLRPGDRIVKVNGISHIRRYDEFAAEVAQAHRKGKQVSLTAQRREEVFVTPLFTPQTETDWNMYCEKEERGVLKGVSVLTANTTVGMTDAKSWSAQKGFQNGDRVVSLNGVPIQTWSELHEYLLHIAQDSLHFKVQREAQGVAAQEMTIDMQLPPEYFLLDAAQKERFLGLHSYEFFIKQDFKEGTAGNRAGLKIWDRLTAINDKPIGHWDEFRETIQTYGKDPGSFYLTYDRGGALNKVQVFPTKTVAPHPCGGEQEMYQIGMMLDPERSYVPLKLERYQELNPFKAFFSATEKSVGMAWMIFKSVGKMLQGKVPLKAMGGPILIGKIAGDHLKQGIAPFLALLAMISINLGVLNLLPIPVLDGGHLLFFVCELIRGRPLSNKILDLANRAGMAVILGLIILVFYNDISRYWSGILSFLKKISGIA